MFRNLLATALLSVCLMPTTAFSQGLFFKVPRPGDWVRYEGTVKQWDSLPDPESGELKRPEAPIEWQRHLHLKCVGEENAQFRGKTEKCVWLEMKVITGGRSELGPDPGLVGQRIYKVLVPTSVLDGKSRDTKNVPVSMLPIIKGFKRRAGEVVPIRSKALRVYPLVTLLAHYKDPKSQQGSPGIPLANSGIEYTGEFKVERKTSQAVNTATYWVSDDIPFGIAKWDVSMKRSTKDIVDPRSSFQESSEIKVEMQAQEIRQDAETEIDEK